MSAPDVPASIPIAIIGAGQAGLAVARYLQHGGLRAGTDFIILDRDADAGGAWQHRWQSLRLDDAHRVHDLPDLDELGLSFATADAERPARDVVSEYYRRYEQYFGLHVAHRHTVRSVQRLITPEGPRYQIEGDSPEGPFSLITDSIVNASGTWGAPHVPYYPGIERFRGRQIHTSGYVAAAQFAGKRVAVVGGGTSAIGFVVELHDIAQVWWFARRPVDFVDQGSLDLEAGRASVAAQDAAARAGRPLPSIVSTTQVPVTRNMRPLWERGELVAQPIFTRIDESGVVLADGEHLDLEAIIWATGFRPDLVHLAPLGLREPAGGIAVADGRSLRDPNVYFAGYGPQASTISASRGARLIAKALIAQHTDVTSAA